MGERQSGDRQYQSVLRPPVPELVIKQILLVKEGNTGQYFIWKVLYCTRKLGQYVKVYCPRKLGKYTNHIALTSSGQYATFQMEYFSVLPSTTNNICLMLYYIIFLYYVMLHYIKNHAI